MMTRESFLNSFIPSSEPPASVKIPPLPAPEIMALNRITYGATPADIEKVRKNGLAKYIDEQLNPSDDEGEAVKNKLASVVFPIKYPAKQDVYPAVDEDRPLALINAPIEKLWAMLGKSTAPMERNRVVEEVRMASWVRAVYSPWQLKEILVEFWHNHFNVTTVGDDKISVTFPIYDREVIRKNSLGNFRAFLEAVSKSAAMQYYLDNFSSKASPANENYARELFELHTLGSDFYFNNLYNRWREVPGALEGKPIGYIDEDVYEAARAFTGWTIADGSSLGRGDNLPNTGNFYYFDGWHDNYQKRVLGVEFEPNQPPLADGIKVLDLVAYHPATARNICKKLCIRFIADEPPQNVINEAVKVWMRHQKSPDQIKETLRYILSTKEFINLSSQKVKRPFELIASLFRITHADVTPNSLLTQRMARMGYLHYQWPAPTGHPDKSSYWLSSNALLARWNSTISLLHTPPNALATYNFRSLTPQGLKTFRDVTEFWIQRMLQQSKPPELIDQVAGLMAGKNKVTDTIPEEDFDKKASYLVGLLAMTPDFQLK